MKSSARFRYTLEPLGDQERASFACGTPELDDYLHRQASQDAKRKVAAPFAMVDQERHVVGYYTLSAYSIRAAERPLELAQKLPKYPFIPATLLGRLAVSRVHRGQKLGTMLLMDALHRSWKNTAEIGSVGVVAEAIDEAARNFYLHHEFIPPLEHPRKLFVAMGTIKKLFG